MNQSDTITELLKVVDGDAPSASSANTPTLAEGDEILELEDFNFDDFQVVRREFFAHMREPSITFTDFKFQVNMACISKFPQFDFAQVLVNPRTKSLHCALAKKVQRTHTFGATPPRVNASLVLLPVNLSLQKSCL